MTLEFFGDLLGIFVAVLFVCLTVFSLVAYLFLFICYLFFPKVFDKLTKWIPVDTYESREKRSDWFVPFI